ncbi:MAG: Ig-like domain-containing protein [Gemmatimonadaceae bacterium]
MKDIIRKHCAALALGIAAMACSGDSPGANNTVVPPEPVARVDLSPPTLSLLVGATGQLTGSTFDGRGNQLSGRSITYSSSDLAVATVSSSGLVTGVAVGSTTITATSEGRSATAAVTVTRPQVASVNVTPASLVLGVGASAQLTAVALGAAGDTLPGRAFTFTSANTAIASVSTAGLVTGVTVGTTTVTVSSEGQSKAVGVTVQAPSSAAVARVVLAPTSLLLQAGTTSQLVASALDSAGVVLAGKVFTFTSSNTSVATVSVTGLVAGVAAGSATITAATEGKQASASITVNPAGTGPGPIARVTLSPSLLSLPVSRQDQLTAVAYDASGVPVPGATYTFTSSSPGVATVTNSGLLTASSAGSTTITVATAGKTATSSITVTPGGGGTITRVDITPASATIPAGSSLQLNGVAYDAQGRVSTSEWYLWVTDNPLVATVSPSGLVTGVTAGTAKITMSAGGFSKTASITVSSSVASSNVIDVNPAIVYQTMTGWQGGGQNGWLECNPTAFSIYKNQLHDRLINELGVERVSIPLRSGTENSRDFHADFVAGRVDMTAYRDSWYSPVNDNNSAFVTDSSKFHWSFLDGFIDNAIIPMRQRMIARGEQLYLVLSYVDFQQAAAKPYQQMKSPDEYAELVTMAFKHLQQKYGFVPDGFELVLEPEHTPYSATDIGRALVAVVSRLRSHGFNPNIFGPSTTSLWNASVWYDGMMQVPGTQGLITELAYHRYVAVSYSALASIGLRAQRDGVKTSMLEHIGSGFDDLYEDLTVANASSWMQFANAFCGMRDNPDNQGVYYQINQTDPNNPRINITNHSKLFRQLFAYVRRGAVRVGATSGNATDLLPLAFRNADGRFVAVVRAKRSASMSIRGLPAGTYGINFGTPGTQWNVELPTQTIGSGGTIQTSIPSDGVITIYGR